MKLSSMQYLLKEGFRSIWKNRFMAIASVGVLVSCLLMSGIAYLVLVNIRHMFDWVYGQNVVVVSAREGLTDEETDELGEKLKSLTNVNKVEFLSKEESLKRYKDSIPQATFEDLQQNNPLPDFYIVTFDDLAKFDATVAAIETIPEVEAPVEFNGELAATLTKMRQMVLAVGGWIIGMLLLVSLFIIANTIKLTVYSRRLEIYIMKSVGATRSFIRIPFVLEGMVLGLASGLLAYGILYLVYTRLATMFSTGLMFGLVNFSVVWWVVLVGFLTAGVLTGMGGSAISMRKYLKEEGGTSHE